MTKSAIASDAIANGSVQKFFGSPRDRTKISPRAGSRISIAMPVFSNSL